MTNKSALDAIRALYALPGAPRKIGFTFACALPATDEKVELNAIDLVSHVSRGHVIMASSMACSYALIVTGLVWHHPPLIALVVILVGIGVWFMQEQDKKALAVGCVIEQLHKDRDLESQLSLIANMRIIAWHVRELHTVVAHLDNRIVRQPHRTSLPLSNIIWTLRAVDHDEESEVSDVLEDSVERGVKEISERLGVS